jgi:hypothetical protein
LVLLACWVEGEDIRTLEEDWACDWQLPGSRPADGDLFHVLILPFGLVVRAFADSDAHTKKRPEKWFDHPPIPNTLEEARRQG